MISAHPMLVILGYVKTALLLQPPHVRTDGIKLPLEGLQSSVLLLPRQLESLQGARQ